MNFPRVSTVVALLAICCFLTLLAGPVFAAPKKSSLVTPIDKRYLVKAVDAADNSISIYSSLEKTTKSYHLDDTTAIQIDGAPAKFADIQVGMQASSFLERDSDDLDSVNLVSKTSAPVAIDTSKTVSPTTDNTIAAVLPEKNAVVIYCAETRQTRTYHVDNTTTLEVEGVPGTFGEIKPGMVVKDYVERDSFDLDSLTIAGFAPQPAAGH